MGDTKERILLTALELFSENGYEAVSVSDIAAELGITKGALYRHYRSKRDIFESIRTICLRGPGRRCPVSTPPPRRRTRRPLPGPCSATGRRTPLPPGSESC